MDLAASLEGIYARYTRREFVSPDPLEVLYAYSDVRDREVVGLFAASLAYGQVRSIVASLQRLLPRLGASPAAFIRGAGPAELARAASGIRHRWTGPEHLSGMLLGVQRALREAGSLEQLYVEEGRALGAWARRLREGSGGVDIGHLLPDPARGSTCKRLHLYLRWMVRCDAVDPGGWRAVAAADLRVPVDVHMHRVARALGFTRRRNPCGRVVEEVTEAFRRIRPDDPVRYDFALTRLGIRERATGGGLRALRQRIAQASVDQVAERVEIARGR